MKRKRLEAIIHLAIWVSAYLLFAFVATTVGVFSSREHTLFYPLTVGTLINAAVFYTASLIIIPRGAALKKRKQLALQLLLLFIGTTILKSVIDFFFFDSIVSTEKEPFEEQIWINAIFGFILMSLAMTYGFIRIWIQKEAQQQVVQQEKLKAELNFLKAQINPHFLFNTLNTAYASATLYGDNRTAGIIDKLSYLIRYMLYESNEERVLLEQEITYIEDYIELQQHRIADEVRADIRFQHKADSHHQIAPLLLLPFVENAFKHGIRLGELSFIDIQLTVADNVLSFSVKNSAGGAPAAAMPQVGGVGLANVRKRLALLYPSGHQLQIHDHPHHFDVLLEINLNSHEMHSGG
ncbi:sensor histidine kinase [Chitinophaga varians]|uniref:sensor histidine kinase n=1 Tax=Chitinophaga varians TaxID=2202339 RepID=UPI00165FFEE4|nr:sensor histidine kinase [Chitinophaga varians]MBC9913028.1 sensor histidine kinase [Chitinophaga varians]